MNISVNDKDLKTFINKISPKHNRTSCDDENSNGNEYFNEMGYPRCTRCTLLYYLRNGEFPHNVTVEHTTVQYKQTKK